MRLTGVWRASRQVLAQTPVSECVRFPTGGAQTAPCKCSSPVRLLYVHCLSTLAAGPSFSPSDHSFQRKAAGPLGAYNDVSQMYAIWIKTKRVSRDDQNHRGLGRKEGLSALSERRKKGIPPWSARCLCEKHPPNDFRADRPGADQL